MTIKQDGIELAATIVFGSGGLRTMLCSGTWQELSATNLQIIQSEAVQIASTGAGYERVSMSHAFSPFIVASNVLPITLTGSFSEPVSITVNRLATMRGGREFGGSPIASITGSNVELSTAPTDWQPLDEVVTNLGEQFTILSISGTSLTLTGSPSGTTSAIASAFGSIVQAKVVPTTILAASSGQAIEVTINASGL